MRLYFTSKFYNLWTLLNILSFYCIVYFTDCIVFYMNDRGLNSSMKFDFVSFWHIACILVFFAFLNHGKVLQNFVTQDMICNTSSVAVCRSLRYSWLTCSLRSNFKPSNDCYSTPFHPEFVINTRCRMSTSQVFRIKRGVAVLTSQRVCYCHWEY
jgi:hypothetical protein